MTDHELVLEHIASNHRVVEEVIRSLVRILPSLDEDMAWIVNEHLRVNKEIQAEYHATKQDSPIEK